MAPQKESGSRAGWFRLGVVGQDEERGDELRVIEFDRIARRKRFDTTVPWFAELSWDC